MSFILTWNNSIALLSLFACVAGLTLLGLIRRSPAVDELEATEHTLMLMTFAYWGVHCIAIGLQKLPLPSWEIVILSLKFTAILTYFLTAACILSLPLHRFAASQQIEE